MSTLADLDKQLTKFRQLPYRSNEQLAEKLSQVQAWQRARMRATHAELFAKPSNQKMAEYFLQRLYGGDEFETLVRQLRRIVPKAQKIEKMAPSGAITTGTLSIQSSVLATELDLHLATWLLENDLQVNEDTMHKAYLAVDEEDARREQINLIKQVCYEVDKHLNSFVLRNAFKLTKSSAYKHKYRELYDFINEGFEAMKPLKSVAKFIEPFCARELEIITEVHATDS